MASSVQFGEVGAVPSSTPLPSPWNERAFPNSDEDRETSPVQLLDLPDTASTIQAPVSSFIRQRPVVAESAAIAACRERGTWRLVSGAHAD